MNAVAALAPGSGLIAAACTALGLSRASLHRRQAFRRQPLAAVRPRPTPMRALVAKEHRLVQDFTKRGMLEENRRDYARKLVNIVKPPENPE